MLIGAWITYCTGLGDYGGAVFLLFFYLLMLKLKPVFKSTPTQFQTILYATSDTQNVGDHDGDMSETKLTERQQKMLNLIKEFPTITGKQMSETLSVSQRTIERDLSAMQKKGVLKREGKDNDGVWIVLVQALI